MTANDGKDDAERPSAFDDTKASRLDHTGQDDLIDLAEASPAESQPDDSERKTKRKNRSYTAEDRENFLRIWLECMVSTKEAALKADIGYSTAKEWVVAYKNGCLEQKRKGRPEVHLDEEVKSAALEATKADPTKSIAGMTADLSGAFADMKISQNSIRKHLLKEYGYTVYFEDKVKEDGDNAESIVERFELARLLKSISKEANSTCIFMGSADCISYIRGLGKVRERHTRVFAALNTDGRVHLEHSPFRDASLVGEARNKFVKDAILALRGSDDVATRLVIDLDIADEVLDNDNTCPELGSKAIVVTKSCWNLNPVYELWPVISDIVPKAKFEGDDTILTRIEGCAASISPLTIKSVIAHIDDKLTTDRLKARRYWSSNDDSPAVPS